MGLKRTIEASEEILTLQETKDHLRLTLPDDDSTVELLIKGVTDYIQDNIQRSLVTQSWEYTLDTFRAGEIQLPLSPVQSITNIKYIDDLGAEITWATSEYTLFNNVIPAFFKLAFDKTYPTTRNVKDAVKITYLAGYLDRTKIPFSIRQAALLIIGHYYERREETQMFSGRIENIPLGAGDLLAPHTRWKP